MPEVWFCREVYDKLRIIIPPLELTDNGVTQEIMNELVSWEDKCKQWEPNHKKLVCPVLHKTSQEWFVIFADLKAHIPISILHCNDSKLKLDDYKKYGQTFLEKAHEAFVQLSLTSPFTKFVSKSLTRVPDLHFHRNYKDSTLASMLCLQWYNGHSSFPVKKVSAFPSLHWCEVQTTAGMFPTLHSPCGVIVVSYVYMRNHYCHNNHLGTLSERSMHFSCDKGTKQK